MRSWCWRALGVVALIAVGLAAWPGRRVDTYGAGPRHEAEAMPRVGARGDGAGTARVVVPASPPAPLPESVDPMAALDGAMPIQEAIAHLLPFAEAGHAEAIIALAMRLETCQTVAFRPLFWNQAPNDRAANLAILEERGLDALPGALGDEVRLQRACRSLDPGLLDPEGEVAWQERAARLGSEQARRRYAQVAVAQMLDRRPAMEVLAELEELIRRRDLARGFVEEGIARGEPWAILARASGGGLLFRPDPLDQIAYARFHALRSHQLAGSADPLRELPADTRPWPGMDADQKRAALARGEAMFSRLQASPGP